MCIFRIWLGKIKRALERWILAIQHLCPAERLVAEMPTLREFREHIKNPQVTITALTEANVEEESVVIPKQRVYTGGKRVIPSSLADVSCAVLGIERLLELLNDILETSRYTIETQPIPFLLQSYIAEGCDFGTAYSRLRPRWCNGNVASIATDLYNEEVNDGQMRNEALDGSRVVHMDIAPRRVWDLHSNRVVSHWFLRPNQRGEVWAISHAWMEENRRVVVSTPINGKQWPIQIPADANLDLIRIEMLNLGAEYAWLDVLCLRQKGNENEELRTEEWKLDLPTMGYVYQEAKRVVYNLSGLGMPLRSDAGDLNNNRCWFKRVWTLQETSANHIIAGDTPDGPLHANLNEEGHYEDEMVASLNEQLKSLENICHGTGTRHAFDVLKHMQQRTSENPIDRVAGLAFLLNSQTIPAYYEKESPGHAWKALVDVMGKWQREDMLFLYPKSGENGKKWRPSWEQVMSTYVRPTNRLLGSGCVVRNDEAGTDWFHGFCIKKGLVKGLNKPGREDATSCDRQGELIVEANDVDKTEHTFQINATHQHLIPEDIYTMLCDKETSKYWVIGRRLSDYKFEKVSVCTMNDNETRRRLWGLRIAVECHNILV
ncbi:uncharacterized protein ARMOST_07073 [Armillaria ostoyae]|uniref:Heterokaryon incompatibility domain-containing protein n=1 Tax=Armillaria ostoyae TaxID=47428 RepID=A0A284R4S2_ARMOS|nr:uncharacterized protein ARMOST_07073 [Armillaria ostoyae]